MGVESAMALAKRVHLQHPLFNAITIHLTVEKDAYLGSMREYHFVFTAIMQVPARQSEEGQVTEVRFGPVLLPIDSVIHYQYEDQQLEVISRWVRAQLYEVVKHEVDEMLMIDTLRPFDPHRGELKRT